MRHWSGIVSRRLRCLLSLELTQTNLFDYTLDDDYSKEQKLSIIDGLILDIQDYRKKIEKLG